MAQENANVLAAAIHVKAVPGGGPLNAVAATGIDLATLKFVLTVNAIAWRFYLNEAIADDVLVVSGLSGPGVSGDPVPLSWRRIAGDATQRGFEILTPAGQNPAISFSVQFWRIPTIGPSVPFTP